MPRVYRQAAVKPYRVHEERVEIALVTSQSGKRLVMPVEDVLTLLHPYLQGFVREAARLIRAEGSRPPVSASVARV